MSDNPTLAPSRSLIAATRMQRTAHWIPFLLAVAVVLVFSGILRNDFTLWDDQETIAANPNFNPPTTAGLAAHWRHPHMDLYVPATYTLWWSVAKIAWRSDEIGGHLDPRPFHVANLALHALSVLVVYSLLRRLIRSDWASAAGALLFALHPVQVETVAWISGGKDLLGALLVLIAIRQYVVAFDPNQNPRRPALHYALAIIALLVALLAKPVAVVTPLLVVIIDRLLLHREWRQIVKSVGPWIAIVVPCLVWTKLFQPVSHLPSVAPWQRILVASDAIAFYVYKLIAPLALAPDYGRRPIWVFASRSAYWTWLLPAAIAAALWWRRRAHSLALAGSLLAVIALLPVLGLVPFDFQIYSTTADHYLYLPMTGIALVAAWGLSRVQQQRIALALASCIFIGLAVLSVRQTRMWRDTSTLFAHTIEVTPDSYAAHSNLATLAYRQSEQERIAAQTARLVFDDAGAAEHLAESRRLDEQYLSHAFESYRVRPESIRTQRRVGDALLRLDRPADAIRYLREAVTSWEQLPDEAQKRRYATTPHLLGVALLRTNRPDEAAACCERTLAYLPDDPAVRKTLSTAQAAIASVADEK